MYIEICVHNFIIALFVIISKLHKIIINMFYSYLLVYVRSMIENKELLALPIRIPTVVTHYLLTSFDVFVIICSKL